MAQAAKPIFKGEPGDGNLTWRANSQLMNQIDEAQLHAAGVKLALGSVWPPYGLRPGRSSFDEALDQLFGLQQFGERRPGFAVVFSAAQARQAVARGRIAVLPAVEGGEGILEVDDVDRLWMAGMRAITLQHFVSSALGGAAIGQNAFNVFGIRTEALEPQGLTPLGKVVVERLMDLGVVLDLAHSSDALCRDVLDLAEARGVPLINSHSAARALLSIERSIPDALAARIVKGGGLVGVTINDKMTAHVPEPQRWPGFVPDTCDDVVAHWLYLAKITGAQSLALGSDFNGFITRHPGGGSCPNGLRNVGDLPDLWAALEAHGVPHAALDGMGERFLTLVEKVEAKAKPEAKAAARKVRRIDAELFAAP